MTVFAGQKARASDYNNLLNKNSPLPLGVQARGNRITTSTTTTTEVGVLRLDDVPMYLGRTYKIWTTPLFLDTTVANDVAAANFRYTTDGSTPTTSSGLLDSCQQALTNATFPNTGSIHVDYTPTSDQLFSVLLTVSRQTGSGNISIVSSSTAPICVVIEDVGLDQTDTGTDI
jgi:hypothetical protein